MNSILVFGRTTRGIVEGDSVPSVFLSRLIARDAEAGKVIEPVLRTGSVGGGFR